jgi:Ca2+-binding EF-hand superfamily protein
VIDYRYFDRNGCGYIKPEDLRRLLHNLGTHAPHRVIKSLVAGVVDKRQERLAYR